MKTLKTLSMTAALCGVGLFATVNGQAATVYLRAATTSLTMPDGRTVPMWGFAQDSAFGSADGAVSSPGPALTLDPADSTLQVALDNDLAEAVSLMIPGLPSPEVRIGDALGGTLLQHSRFTDGAGRQRARSLVGETPAGNIVGGVADTQVWYVWNNVQPGTYLYHSGSHVGLQVQMGLYGALTKNTAANTPYAGITVAAELTLLFSEVDADLHDAVSAGDYGPTGTVKSTLDSVPQYFLINGQAYQSGQTATTILDTAATAPALLRFLNAGQDTRVPILDNSELTLIAEDGRPYAYARTAYSVLLPALKTADALWTPTGAGAYSLYDRRQGLFNNLQPGPGGMLVQLQVVEPNAL